MRLLDRLVCIAISTGLLGVVLIGGGWLMGLRLRWASEATTRVECVQPTRPKPFMPWGGPGPNQPTQGKEW